MSARAFKGLLLSGLLSAALACRAAADGEARSHDFDFKRGLWNTHIQRVLDPFAANGKTLELNGTVFVRPVWDGSALLEEIEADGPNGHWQALTLFLYNPKAKQWSQNFLNSRAGNLALPLVGSFKDGRGEMFSQDTFKDRGILVRGLWSGIEKDSHRYEESYSDDGGLTWHPAFIATLTRAKAGEVAHTAPDPDRPTDFDFDFGAWHTHSSRLMHPLSGAKDWVEMDGATRVEKVWGGRANLAVFKADGPAGPLELLALRWYNPAAHQWNIDFATPNVGTLGIPGVGTCRSGRCEFFDQETIGGKAILVRFAIWGINADAAQSEQAFSEDGGKNWDVNWINRYTRARP